MFLIFYGKVLFLSNLGSKIEFDSCWKNEMRVLLWCFESCTHAVELVVLYYNIVHSFPHWCEWPKISLLKWVFLIWVKHVLWVVKVTGHYWWLRYSSLLNKKSKHQNFQLLRIFKGINCFLDSIQQLEMTNQVFHS